MASRPIPRPLNPFVGGLPGTDPRYIAPLMSPTPMAQQPLIQPMPQRPTMTPQLMGATPMGPAQTFGNPLQVPGAMGAGTAPLAAPAAGGGFKAGFKDFLGSDAALAMAAGILEGGTSGQAIGRGFNYALQAKNRPGADYPEAYKLWELAGKPGSFGDWYMQSKKAGGTNVNVGNEKLTESQAKDIGFYSRGRSSDIELETLEEELISLPGYAAGQAGVLGQYAKTPQYQQAERAGREFLAVVLRKDTGAAVTPAEFELYGPMYLPQPGDAPEVIATKRDARKRAMNAIKLGLGTARGLADEVDAELEAIEPAASSAAPADPYEAEAVRRGWIKQPDGSWAPP